MPKKNIKIGGILWESVDTLIVSPDRVLIKFKWQGKPTEKRYYKLDRVELVK